MAEVGQLGAESEELRLAWAWLQHATDLVTSGQLRSHLRSYTTHPKSIIINNGTLSSLGRATLEYQGSEQY